MDNKITISPNTLPLKFNGMLIEKNDDYTYKITYNIVNSDGKDVKIEYQRVLFDFDFCTNISFNISPNDKCGLNPLWIFNYLTKCIVLPNDKKGLFTIIGSDENY